MMKIISQRPVKGGTRVTVVLQEGEVLKAFDKDGLYRLGAQMDEIVPAEALTDAQRVSWCHFEQKFVD